MTKTHSNTLYVIIPANNEEAYLERCLRALLGQAGLVKLWIVVAANACTDRTLEIARSFAPRFAAVGHHLSCLDLAEPGKLNALRHAEAQIPAPAPRVYLDADVRCDPNLMSQLSDALKVDSPRYATGMLTVMPPQSFVTRAYARFWQALPFVKSGAVGAGLFAVNGPGRARWDAFPDIISDDTFVRLHFEPTERIEVPARYHWPMIEGARNLIRVRRRQDQGVKEIAQNWPELMAREGKAPLGLMGALRLARRDPIGFVVYSTISLAVRLGRKSGTWTRGR